MKIQTIPHKYQFKRGKSGAFDGSTLLLEAGEPFIEYREDKTIVGMKIGDGVNYYDKLPFLDEKTQQLLSELIEEVKILQGQVTDAGDSTYFVTEEEWNSYPTTDIEERISYFIDRKYEGATPTVGNLFVIKSAVIKGSTDNTYQIYVLSDNSWEQIVGNTLSADKIVFSEDIKYTEPIGKYNVPSTGYGYIAAKGKTIEQLFSEMLCYERTPEISEPTVTFTVEGFHKVAVGTSVTLSYRLDLDPGSFEFGPTTGAYLDNISVVIKNNGKTVSTYSESSGGLVVTAEQGDQYTIECECTVITPNKPVTNLGNQTTGISARSFNFNPKDTLTAYVPLTYIYGYRTDDNKFDDITQITGAELRSEFTTTDSIPTVVNCSYMKQLVIAVPEESGIVDIDIVNASNNTRQEIEEPFYVYDVPSEDGDETSTYIVFYVENFNADTGRYKYNITYYSEVEEV